MTPPSAHVHAFYAAKGGQGTTVVAATVALIHAEAGRRTLLIDAADQHDVPAVLGMPEPVDPTDVVTVTTNLDLRIIEPHADAGDLDGYDVVIIDNGQHRPELGTATLVTRACYLALRRALAVTPPPDDTIIIKENGRALNGDDVGAVLNIPILATIPVDAAIARVVDAGLLTARLPGSLSHLRAEITARAKATA